MLGGTIEGVCNGIDRPRPSRMNRYRDGLISISIFLTAAPFTGGPGRYNVVGPCGEIPGTSKRCNKSIPSFSLVDTPGMDSLHTSSPPLKPRTIFLDIDNNFGICWEQNRLQVSRLWRVSKTSHCTSPPRSCPLEECQPSHLDILCCCCCRTYP